MIAIFKREFRSYFINMSGYVFIGVLWLFSGIFATALNLIGQYAAYEYALSNLVTVLMLIVPILTMRSMSEDRRAKTDMLLYSLPVSSTEVILGKYFAMLAVWGVACLGMGATPIILGMFGEVNFASAYGALLGFFLLGAALIAVCTFVSSLTENQLIAAILGIASSLGLARRYDPHFGDRFLDRFCGTCRYFDRDRISPHEKLRYHLDRRMRDRDPACGCIHHQFRGICIALPEDA